MKAFLFVLLFLAAVPLAHAERFVIIVRHHAGEGNEQRQGPGSIPGGRRARRNPGKHVEGVGDQGCFRRLSSSGPSKPRQLWQSVRQLRHGHSGERYKRELSSKLRGLNANALVVGHGNTIPNLIKALGIDSPINIPENDYSQILVVTLGAKPQLLRLSYPNDSIRLNGYNVQSQSSPAK